MASSQASARLYSAAVAVLLCFIHTSADVLACSASQRFPAADAWHCHDLSSNIMLFYRVDNEAEELVLGVEATDHAGWIGIGINSNSGMKGASMVVVREDEQGGWVAEDLYSETYTAPMLDAQQDVELVSAEASNGGVSWTVRLPLDSCDDQDYPIMNITQTVIWAAGAQNTFSYHGSRSGIDRGSVDLNLFMPSSAVEIVDPEDAFTLEFRMPNVLVQSSQDFHDPTNPYICAAFDTSRFGQDFPPAIDPTGKYHVTRYEPIIDEETAPYVHHMLMNSCELPPSYAVGEDMGGWVKLDCESMREAECSSGTAEGSDFGWSVGGTGDTYPAQAGLPWNNRSRYFAIQVHYYNPHLIPNLRDSSGFRVVVSPTTRTYDVGVFWLVGAVRNGQASPLEAGQRAVWRSMQVPSSCLEPAFESAGVEEVQLLSVYHHAHMRGTQMAIQVFRDGRELGFLRQEKVYDYQHQAMKEPEIRTLRKGDSLLLRCRYDTSSDSESINFGELTTDEMCLAGVRFFPALPNLFAFGLARNKDNGNLRTACPNGSGNVKVVESNPLWAFNFQGKAACARKGGRHHDGSASSSSLEPRVSSTSSASASWENSTQAAPTFTTSLTHSEVSQATFPSTPAWVCLVLGVFTAGGSI